jgi:hypothetical protein
LQTTVTLPTYQHSTAPSPFCASTHMHCTKNTSQCIPKDQFCNFNPECTDGSDESSCPRECTFEGKTFCLWTHDTKQKLQWEFDSGQTATPATGPTTGKLTC